MLLGRGIIDIGSFSQGLGVPQQQITPIQPVQRSIGQFMGSPRFQPPMDSTQPVQPTTPVVSDVQQPQPISYNNHAMTTMPVQQPQPQAFAQPVSKELPMMQANPMSTSVGVGMGAGKGRGGMEFTTPIKTLPLSQTY